MGHYEEKGWWEQNWKWATGCSCLGCVGLPLLLIAVITGGIFTVFQQAVENEAYNQAVEMIQVDSRVIERLGTPIDVGRIRNFNSDDEGSKAHLEAVITGPNGTARMLVDGREVGDHWNLEQVIVRFSDGVEIEMLDETE